MIYQQLTKIFSKIHNPTIIEIGAHIGTDTLKLLKFEPDIYYAIEPDRRNIATLNRRLSNSDVNIIPVAISNKDGLQDFYLSQGTTDKGRLFTDANSLLRPISSNSRSRVKDLRFTKTQVMCRTLDKLFTHLPVIDLIWMDVQGGELLVFEGGKNTLLKTRYIYTECQEGRYQGQPGIKLILEALPNWIILKREGDNILLRNQEWKK